MMNQCPETFRIMSFNIRYDNPQDLNFSWNFRKERVASMIRFHQADLCGLQEVLLHQLYGLLDDLPDYGYIGVGREDGVQAGEFSPILYDKKRFFPIAHDTFWLSETPDIKGSLGWDAVCKRIVTWAMFKDNVTQKVFFHFNTHFDHFGETAKIQSAYLLKERLSEISKDQPAVVTGDFNSTPDSKVYDILTGPYIKKLTDCRHCAVHGHHGPTITFHAFRGNEYIQSMINEDKLAYKWHGEEMFLWIDYIFVGSRVKVLQEGVLADHWDGIYPSDHSPVVADLTID